ncbi:MAG TPA: SPFH domain-containing protein, partial [Jiangellaceae bacterium]|nr:SPFH domain-containing protein [Jiangellaceae bacterium]
GCTALVSRFGKVEAEVGPGRVTLWNPWKRVSYIVNTTREYPFNAPIREAPTKSGVQASVDLFLQFRIVNAREFVFVLGAVQGFQDKLNNAVSETTRSLIYEQEAAGIYDLVGESTVELLEQLNAQFAPAVELTTANITHAEPSAQEYRMDLAAPEMLRVAKEAYTYDYNLSLKKEQNEGDLSKDLASLNENLSAIQADIARYQAQMDTALERETNRANALARQRFVESESTANANAASLEAQALDIRALSAALAPEILEYRYQQEKLDKMEDIAGSLPQIVRVGEQSDGVDFLQIASDLVGSEGGQLFSAEDMDAIRSRRDAIAARVDEREEEIAELLHAPEQTEVEVIPASESHGDAESDDRLDEIRQSVTDSEVAEEFESEPSGAAPEPGAAAPDVGGEDQEGNNRG